MKKILFFALSLASSALLSAESKTFKSFFEAQGTQFSLKNLDFTQGTQYWTFGPKNQTNPYTADNGILKCESKTEAMYYNLVQKNLSVPEGNVLRVSFEGKNLTGSSYFNVTVMELENGKQKSEPLNLRSDKVKHDWKKYQGFLVTDASKKYGIKIQGYKINSFQIRNLKIDYVPESELPETLERNEELFVNNHFEGPSESRVKENLSRSPVAIKHPSGGQLLTWRFLEEDSASTCFTVSKTKKETETVLTKKPITDSTNFHDKSGKPEDVYTIKVYSDSSLSNEIESFNVTGNKNPYKSIKLHEPNTIIMRMGVGTGDLDGDGAYDFVMRTVNGDFEIGESLMDGEKSDNAWKPSKNPIIYQAFTNDGTHLWSKNRGWNIESGLCYAPFVIADLDGDGKAEFICKTADDTNKGEKDYRDSDKRVLDAPEYLSVCDGLTGKEICRTPWLPHEGFMNETFQHRNHNQIGIAYLDGKTPCIVISNGKWDHFEMKTFCFKDNELVPIWTLNTALLGNEYKGQAPESNVYADIDGDGRDEILFGSIAIDDNGEILWTTGKGHPDAVYFGDINPDHPGYEIVYLYETAQEKGGIMQVDTKGNLIWEMNEPSNHVHSRGLCSDFDPKNPGREIFGQNVGKKHAQSNLNWLFSSTGKLLKKSFSFGPKESTACPSLAYITDKPYSSVIKSEDFMMKDKFKLDSSFHMQQELQFYDCDGDWREEILCTDGKGELRIYSTVDVAKNRRKALTTDNFYRNVVTANSSGYHQHPELLDGMKFE